jgi:hypothetical protein
MGWRNQDTVRARQTPSRHFYANWVKIHIAKPLRTAQAHRVEQRASVPGRDVLMRLVAKHGLQGAARVLQA